MIPRVLKNFNLFINGTGYAGLCDEAEMPDLKIKTENHRGGGMDSDYEIDMGMDAMTVKLTLGEYAESVISAFGSGNRIQLRGSIVRDSDGTHTPIICEIQGRQKTLNFGKWKAGDKTQPAHEFTVDYFRWNQGGSDLIVIDVINMIRLINGVDQLANIRSDLAM